MKINVLSPKVFNMIAAGEVVERPSSVVKELLENAVDAGATQVDIKIANGGIGLIQVSDNGIGISEEDIETAFLPHATSKISKYEDLDTISTLGFRGEALPSIASVSKVEIISKYKDAIYATKLCLNGGKVISKSKVSRQIGTIISVSDLFYNTPARLKFLKKESSEQKYIIEVVKNFALANPDITLTLSDEKNILLSQNQGKLYDSLYSVFDAKTVENLMEIEAFTVNSITVKGYSSKIAHQKPNRTYQYIMVNGRNIKDQSISIAVEKAYENYVMKRNFPAFVLDIIMPFDDVDVNVHPSKTEVRFRNPKAVFSAVFHAVQNAVNKDAFADNVNLISKSNQTEFFENENEVSKVFQTRIDTAALFNSKTVPKNSKFNIGNEFGLSQKQIKDSHIGAYSMPFNNLSDSAKVQDVSEKPYNNSNSSSLNEPEKLKSSENKNNEDLTLHKDFTHSFQSDNYGYNIDNNIGNYEIQKNVLNENPIFLSHSFNANNSTGNQNNVFDGKILGQLFDTYIILERDEIVYIIDQHAAHERILYDKIVSSMSNEFAQPLLFPLKLTLSENEKDFISDKISQFSSLGFEIGIVNDEHYLKSVPAFFAKLNLSKLIDALLSDIDNIKDKDTIEILKETLCQQACKQAIKGGDSLTREQLEYVVKNFLDDKGNLPSQCPHGRPAILTFTKAQIEKLFKRIV